jgi:hypothetical protein
VTKPTNIEKLEKELEFILGLWMEQRKTFSLLKAFSTHHDYIRELYKNTDLFALMQNKLTEIIILDLCKMFEYNPKNGISIPNLLVQAKEIFTEQYFDVNKEILWENETFQELNQILNNADSDLEKNREIIKKIKKLRNKLIAHYDGKIDTFEKAENLYLNSSSSFSLSDHAELNRIGDEVLETIKLVIFGIAIKTVSFEHYDEDLEKIANALHQFNYNSHGTSN